MQKQIDLDLAIKLHSSLNIAVDSSVAFSVQLNSERQSFSSAHPPSFLSEEIRNASQDIRISWFGGFISFPSPGLKDLSVALTQRRDTP